MADLGNLFFRLGIKDEEAQKVLDRIEQRLVNTGYKVKLQAPNANEFLRDLREQLKSQTLDVRAKVVSSSTTGAVTTPADLRYTRMLEVQQRMANATAIAHQRLANERNRDVRASERHAAAMLRNNETFKKANQSISKQYKLLGDLQKQVISVYSLKMMEQFLVRVVEIGGEFQKQHIALNAMLGDAARADAMFSKIKTLAVESPFNFRELMSFNKQIAAFGIPYEEMYETTKRLADISAGLGVDMGRIILAYGQVRSAAFLRGQELRQFTEAGIPLVDELAKKFTELEGRVVSAGEVLEKISRREVSFGMVKDVLWELTSEGGKFYNMQEVLTESLSGKLAKLKDSWEIMLSTIAEGNNGPLASTIDFLTRLTDKWEEVWNAIKILGAAYATYKAAMLVASTLKAVLIRQEIAHTAAIDKNTIAQYANNKALTKAEVGALSLLLKIQKLKTAITSLGWAGWVGVLLSALTAVTMYFINLNSEADKLGEKLREISDSTDKEIRSSVSGYKLLINKLHKVKEKYGETANQTKEYADIVKQINTSYGQYLDNLFHESEAYDTIAASIERVTSALEEKKRSEQYQKSMSAIDESYSGLLSEAQSDLADRVETVYNLNKKDAKKFAQEIINLITNEKKGADEATQLVAEMFNKPYKIFGSKIVDGKRVDINHLGSQIGNYMWLLKERDKAYEDLLNGFDSRPLQKYLNDIDKDFEDRYKAAKDDVNKLRELDIEKREAYLSIYESKGLGGSSYASKLRSEIESLKRWGDEWVVVAGNIRDKVYADNKRDKHGDVTEKFLETLIPSTDDVSKGMLSSYIEKLAQQWEPINEQLKKELERETDYSTESDLYSIARLKDQKQYIEEFLKAIGLSTDIFDKKKEKKKSSKDIFIENMKERLRLLKAAHDEYKKWSSIEGHIAASERVKNSGIFDMLFSGNEPVNLDDYTGEVEKIRNSIADAIQRTSTKERREAYSEAVKIVMDIEYDLDKYSLEQVLRQSENMIKEELDRWNLFKSIREKTGNESLALSLSFGQFNVGENDYMKKLRKQASEKLEGKNVTFDDILYYDEEMLKQEGLAALVPFVKAYKEAQSDLRKSTAETITDLLEKNKDYALKIAEIERKKNEKIKSLRDNRELLESSGIDVDSRIAQEDKNADEEKGAILFEEFKKTEDWVRIFDDLDRVSSATLDNMIKNIEDFALKQNLSVEDTKELVEALRKLREENISRGSWGDFSKSLKELKEAKRAVKEAREEFKKSQTKENEDKLKNAENEKRSKQVDANKALRSGIDNMREYLNAGNEVLGIMKDLGLSTPEWMNGFMDGVGEMLDGLEHIDITKPMSLITGSLKFARGALGAITSLGGIIDWKGSNAKEVAELQNRLIESNKILGTSIDDLREEISKSGGIKAIDDSLKAKEYQKRLNKNLLDIAWAQAGYHNTHGSWNKYWGGFNQEQINRLSGRIGRDWDGNIFNLTPEEMKKLREEADMWKQIQDTGKGGYGHRLTEKLDAYIEQAGKLEEIESDLAESLTQITFDGLRDEFMNSLMDMDKSAQDFASDFERYMMKAMLNSKMSDMLDKDIKAFYDAWNKYSQSDKKLDKDEIEKLREEWQKLVDKGLAIRDEVSSITGYEGDGKESNSVSKGIAGVTEETADLLASYINAIRADVSVGRVMQEKFFNTDFPQLSAVAQAQLTQLNAIAANTSRNVELVGEIYSLLNKNIKGINRFNV